MEIRSLTSVCAALALSLAAPVAEAQVVDRLLRRAGSAAEDELARKVDNLVRNGVRCAVGDRECVEDARRRGRTPVMTDAGGNILTDDKGAPITDPAVAAAKVAARSPAATPAGPAAAPGAVTTPGTGAWANYDFVPGDRVLFADDFRNDRVGDFPRRFELIAGNWEVVEWQGVRYLRATSSGVVALRLPEALPDRFTIEFPASVQHGNSALRITTAPLTHGARDYAGSVPSFEYSEAGLESAKKQGPRTMATRRAHTRGAALVTVRVMADGAYMKMFVNDQRVANAPNAVFPRTNTLYFSAVGGYEETPTLIGPVHVAAGGRDLYDALATDGRVATQGIYFDVNSAVIRPESSGTLREIGEMLRAHPELQLTIEGHTDSDGDDASNLDLSARRAAAVKAHLVAAYGVADGRLTATGLGETRPVADNGTPEGKQQNRRVELVRQGA